jgi:glycosyltransferase involved in cell wall biosynthesis
VALIHHPTSLETGLSDPARDSLRVTERRLFPLLRRVIVTSADTAKRLVDQFDVVASRIAVVEPATPPAPRSEGPSRPGCLILSVATLTPRKGHDVLLRALARLMDLDWRLVIVGGAPDPALRDRLRALTVELGLADRVEFAGEIAPERLGPYWDEAAIFALATHYEGYGMAIAEALRRGIPVAVTAGGAAAALAVPECSVVCEPGDHAGLSKALRRMIYDRPLRLDMAEAAWRVGASLPDWDTQARRFAEALEDR